MGSLPRRIAAVTLTAAALIGIAGTATNASAATITRFKAYGVNPTIAGNHAWAAAFAAGYTVDQCYSDAEVVVPGYWEVIVTCAS